MKVESESLVVEEILDEEIKCAIQFRHDGKLFALCFKLPIGDPLFLADELGTRLRALKNAALRTLNLEI